MRANVLKRMSSVYLPLGFFLTWIFALQLGMAEQMKMKISLKSRDDGRLAASVFIGNATRKLMKNMSLELVVDTIYDNSESLIGARGFVRENKRNNRVELYTYDDVPKDEEMQRFLFFCPEKGEEILDIVARTRWGFQTREVHQKRIQAADFLIVDAHSYTVRSDYDFLHYMRDLEYHQVIHFGDLWCNYWISDDGMVFEGIGWDYYNYINNGGLGPKSLIIGFVKSERETSPSTAAVRAFRELVKTAICAGKLSLHYSIIPYHLINDYCPLSAESFERKEMRNWAWYKGDLDFLFNLESDEKWDLPVVPNSMWRKRKSNGLMTVPSPIEYLVVKEFGGRCFSDCLNYLKIAERVLLEFYGHVNSNFFVAEDGRAYEAEGWDKTWNKHYQKKKAVEVTFLGHYFSYDPQKPIILALKSLIKEGLRSGKLSREYKIVTIKTVNPSSYSLGRNLEENIRQYVRYTDTFW